MTADSDAGDDKMPIALLRGKEGKMNREIIKHLVIHGPSTMYSIAMELQKISENAVHYSTVNRRIHDLAARNYVEIHRKVEAKSGFSTDEYITTIRGDFAALALEMAPSQLRLMLANAGRRKNSPFMLLKLVIESGVSEKVQQELICALSFAVRDEHIDLEKSSEGAMSAGFASIMYYRLKTVLLAYRNDFEKVLGALRYLIFQSSEFRETDGEQEPYFSPEFDMGAEVRRVSRTKEFQELFGPGGPRRSMNSQYFWIYRMYDELMKIQ